MRKGRIKRERTKKRMRERKRGKWKEKKSEI